MRSLLFVAAYTAHALARHSLNYGPSIQPTSVLEPSEPIVVAAGLSDDPSERGQAIANAFVSSLHPELSFALQGGHLSIHNGVYHAHFRQRHNKRDIVTATLSLNIDVQAGVVLSYADASHAVTAEQSRCRGVADKLARLGEGAQQQFVLGATGGQAIGAELEACMAKAEQARPVDPRAALIAFLIPVKSAEGIHAVAGDADFDELTMAMTIEHLFTSTAENRIRIHGAPGAEEPVSARLAYIQHDGALKLVWSFVYRSPNNWYEASVAAAQDASFETLSVVDWVRDFAPTDAAMLLRSSHRKPRKPDTPEKHEPKHLPPREPNAMPEYLIYPWGVNDPSAGKRHLVVDPHDRVASPSGWHTIPAEKSWRGRTRDADWQEHIGWSRQLGGGLNATDTRGNNVWAQDNPTGGNSFELNYRPHAQNLNFSFPLHWGPKANRTGRDIDPVSYIDVAVTQLFVTCNEMHDLFYRYGFDEAAGNFQQHNFGNKGLGDDAVIANAQDGSGRDNANFATPPDGQHGRMRMYVWDGAKPWRDGDLEEGIVIHEYAHGISTRLTGSPSDSSCLGWGEAGGMGEGWGDAFATLIRMHGKKQHDWTMGEWAASRGIRNYPYSTNMTHNPSTFKFLDRPAYFGVHAIGEVWATYLFEVAENLIGKHGWHSTLFPPLPSTDDFDNSVEEKAFYNISSITGKRHPAHGNTLAVQLIVDGMKLQPCRPSFVNARDAILQADKILTGGDNACLIWSAFSKRGLGPAARTVGSTPWGGGLHQEDFSLPSACKSHKL